MPTPLTTTYIYTITCADRVYIGQTINPKGRWNQHTTKLKRNKHANPKLQACWNKYGPEAFEFKVISECAGYLADTLEFVFIGVFKQFLNIEVFNFGVNVKNPMRGRKHTDEAKKKISENNKGRHQITPEHRAKLTAGQRTSEKLREHARTVGKLVSKPCAFVNRDGHRLDFENQNEAANYFNVCKQRISKVMNMKKGFNSIKGYKPVALGVN